MLAIPASEENGFARPRLRSGGDGGLLARAAGAAYVRDRSGVPHRRGPEGHYRWITPGERTLLGYVVGERVVVLANRGKREGVFRFDLREGEWRQVGGREAMNLNGVAGAFARLGGGEQEVRVPGGSFLVWVLTR